MNRKIPECDVDLYQAQSYDTTYRRIAGELKEFPVDRFPNKVKEWEVWGYYKELDDPREVEVSIGKSLDGKTYYVRTCMIGYVAESEIEAQSVAQSLLEDCM